MVHKSQVSSPGGSGSGTVTNVAMTGDGVIFETSVTGSPITSSGTLIPSLINQSANTVFAGPSTSPNKMPSFRSLVATDMPIGINAINIADGTVSNTEFEYINSLNSNAQTQLDNKVPYTGANTDVNLGTNSITAFNFSGSSSGTNTGDQTISLTGDATGNGTESITLTLATVNTNTGTWGNATQASVVVLNGKGLVTGASNVTITPAISSVTGLGTGIATALSINIASAGAPVLFNGAGGTPSSITLTNGTGTASGLTAGTVTTNANLTGDITSVGNATTLATVNSNVGTFGTASNVFTGTVNAKGLITAASNTAIQITESQVTNLTTDLAAKQSTTLTSGHILVGNISNVATDIAMSGDATLNNSGNILLSTVNSNVGIFGSSTAIPSFTTGGKGLIVAASTNPVIAPAGTLTGATLATNVVNSSLTSFGAGPTISLPVIDNTKLGYTTTTTAAGTTTLTSASNYQQFFTGSTTQTVVLPVTSTLALGEGYRIVNNSTGVVTVQSSGANAILAMVANSEAIFTVILASGTTVASWSAEYTGFTSVTGTGANVLAVSPTFTTPALGTPSSGILTNCTGTASGLTAGTVTTNANLTGAITSSGNATSLGSFSSANLASALTDETGSGAAVFATSPMLVAPLYVKESTSTTSTANGITIEQASTGDAILQYLLTGSTRYQCGIDNSNADSYTEGFNSSLGTTPNRIVSTAGEQTMPLQPSFLAYNSVFRSAVTGNGTSYLLIFNTEVFDQNNDFDGASTFTAPITATTYGFKVGLLMGGILITHTSYLLVIVTSNRTYEVSAGNPGTMRDGNGNMIINASISADMDIGDTAYCYMLVSGSTQVINIGNAATDTFFTGSLIC